MIDNPFHNQCGLRQFKNKGCNEIAVTQTHFLHEWQPGMIFGLIKKGWLD
jgi:hypothetical protein